MPLLLIWLLLPACQGDNKEASTPSCIATETDVALDEVSPLGFAPAEMLAQVPASDAAEFTYADASSTTLSLGFAPGTTATFVDLEADYPDTGEVIDIGVICDDYVAVDVDLDFQTDDGVFDEALSSELHAGADLVVTLHVDLDLAAMGGTFDIGDYTTETDWDDARAGIDVAFTDGGPTSGIVAGDVSGQDECADGDQCSAWSSMVEVGTWGDAGE